MISAIETEDLRKFDGIILTHGTDTLAFSAAALGLYFNNLPIPLLLVSSNLPLDNPQANGFPNFHCAVDFVRKIPHAGAFVVYQNPDQNMQVYRATRLASCLQLSGDFIGVQSKAFMHFIDGKFICQEFQADKRLTFKPLTADFSARILLIKPYPGLDYSQINLTGVHAVLHDLYHSGTACIATEYGEQHSLSEFIRRCRQQQLKIYLAPAMKSEQAYSSTRELLALGAEMIWNMSLETAYAKLLLAYGNFNDSSAIGQFLEQDIAFEHILDE
jgi:L-asparaginase